MNIVFILLMFSSMAVMNAVIFYILINRDIRFRDVFVLTTVATALNKFLFTGSGYLAGSYFSRYKNLSFHKAISAFMFSEFMIVSLWLILGIIFGVKLAIRVPVVMIIVLFLFIIAAFIKRNKFISFSKNVFCSFKEMKSKTFMVLPFILVHMAAFAMYYLFLFRYFNFQPVFFDIIKITAVSFTIGYLSPAPGGVGFREAGLVVLLRDKGLAFDDALTIAVWDRVIVTVFWAVLGSVVGFDLIKYHLKLRFKKVL